MTECTHKDNNGGVKRRGPLVVYNTAFMG